MPRNASGRGECPKRAIKRNQLSVSQSAVVRRNGGDRRKIPPSVSGLYRSKFRSPRASAAYRDQSSGAPQEMRRYAPLSPAGHRSRRRATSLVLVNPSMHPRELRVPILVAFSLPIGVASWREIRFLAIVTQRRRKECEMVAIGRTEENSEFSNNRNRSRCERIWQNTLPRRYREPARLVSRHGVSRIKYFDGPVRVTDVPASPTPINVLILLRRYSRVITRGRFLRVEDRGPASLFARVTVVVVDEDRSPARLTFREGSHSGRLARQ